MPSQPYPSSNRVLTKAEARRFLLAQQHLWPPRSLKGKAGILEYIHQVGCIQFDPIDVVGRNPELVLQARIAAYQPRLLESLLYEDRRLWDGWDKMASIYAIEDWPHYKHRRNKMREWHRQSERGHMAVVDEVLETLRENGPLSSLEFKNSPVIDWAWGRPASVARAALEALFEMGRIGISKRVGSRRYYDLVERLVPGELLNQPEPHKSLESYQTWHILRRIGGLGLANARAGEYWLGILGVKSQKRRRIIVDLIEVGELELVEIEGLPREIYFLKRSDLQFFEKSTNQPPDPAGAAFLAPLDNFLWDRRRLKNLFGFEYIWEVYKPIKDRMYGYYVLPVLCGDELMARVEFGFDKRQRNLTLVDWWWEENIRRTDRVERALSVCLGEFCAYLQASSFQLGGSLSRRSSLDWARAMEF